MLAEIAVANAAFGVIKNAISNGQELHSVANQVTNYFNSKSVIAKKANKSGNKSDMEAFMALETLKEQETELREAMQWHGRAGLWDDWLAFQSQAKKDRALEEKERLYAESKNRQRLAEIMAVICTVLVGLPAIGGAAYIIFSILGSVV
jgi:hypothetical protein